MKKNFFLIFATLLLFGCGQESYVRVPPGWEDLDAYVFTVSAPQGWVYTPEQGIDSTIGTIQGDGITLEFDYGMYSGFIDNDTDVEYSITEKTIDGYQAKIAVPTKGEKGLTIVYFESAKDGNRFNLYTHDLRSEDQATVLKIFDSIEFKQ